MATTKSMQNCVAINSSDHTQNRLPQDIKDAITSGRSDLTKAALKAHIDNITTLRKEVIDQHHSNMQTEIDTLPAKRFTSRKDDPTNELNTFKPIGGLKILVKNLVQRAGSIYNAAKKFLVLTRAEDAVVNHFNETFNIDVSAAIDALFNVKEGKAKDFRHEDMIQYFTEHDADAKAISQFLDPTVKEAIAASIYEWLGTEASRTSMGIQSEESLRQFLGLAKGEPVPTAAWDALGGIGMNTDRLATILGQPILDRLSITDTDASDAVAKKRLQSSLGLMAIAAMEQMQLVERQELFADALNIIKDGGIPDNVLFDIEIHETRENKLLLNSTLLKHSINPETDKVEPIPRVATIEKLIEHAPDTFNKLFNNEPHTMRYSFGLIPLKGLKIGRTAESPSSRQLKNLQNYVDTPWVPSTHPMDVFEALLPFEEDPETNAAFGTIFGKESQEGKLNAREKSITGLNRGIDRDLNSVKKFMSQAKELKNSRFYIPSDFMNNMRMLMRGHINPQNSKLMRNLFSPESWKKEFNPNYGKRKLSSKEGIERAFFEAIAQALDIESAKYGGVPQQLDALDNLLNHPDRLEADKVQKHLDLKAAIVALQEFDRTKQMTPQLVKDIAVGVKATEMKLHGFKGLQEYARYLNHEQKTEPFTTDIYKEIDGVSNGPIIGMLMLMSNAGSMLDKLAAFAMGGVSISRQNQGLGTGVNLDEMIGPKNQFLNDAYQRMGQVWAMKIELLKKEFKDGDKNHLLVKAEAIGNILGPFHKEGVVNKIVRNLSKPRTMQTTYGAGTFRQSKLFADIDLIQDGIYTNMEKIIEKIIANNNQPSETIQTELEQLLKDVSVLSGTAQRNINAYVNTDGTFNIEGIQAFVLNKKEIKNVETAVQETYGKAMSQAIEEVYAPIIEARKPLLDAINTSTIMYNVILKAKVEKAIEDKILVKEAEIRKEKGYDSTTNIRQYTLRLFPELKSVTKAELAIILKEMEPLMPKIPTPIHTEKDPSYLQLVSFGKDKKFAQASEVEQIYKKGTLVRQWGFPRGIPFLDSPGAAPMVKAIQMIDSMIANHLMGLGIDILNNHDGFSHAITDSDIVGIEANKEFFRILNEYSLGEEITKMHNSTVAAARKMAIELGIKSDVILDQLVEERIVDVDLVVDLIAERNESLKRVSDKEVIKEGIKKDIYALTNTGTDYFVAVRKVIKERLSIFSTNALTKKLVESIGSLAESMSKEVTENKAELVPLITRIAQYSNSGFGFDPQNPNLDQDTIFGVDRDQVSALDAMSNMKFANTLNEMVQQGMVDPDVLGSNPVGVSNKEQDYPAGASKIDGMNVTQVFETIAQQDANAGFGSVLLSAGHKAHLTRILDEIVARVMTPVQLFMKQHAVDNETRGIYSFEGKQIFLQTQQFSTLPKSGMLGHGIRMSAAETYAHELSHHILESGLQNSVYERKHAYNLYEFTRDAFEAKYGANAFRVFMNDPDADLNDPANTFEIQAAQARWKYIFKPTVKKNKTNHGVSEFLAFGLTNENFKRELATLTLPDRKKSKALFGVFEKNVQQTVVNLFNKIMDFIHQQFYGQEHSKQADIELENLVRAIAEVDNRAKSGVYREFVKASEATSAFMVKMDEKAKSVASKAWTTTKLGNALAELKKFPEADNIISHKIRLALMYYGEQGSRQGVLSAIGTEMQGTTSRVQPLHELQNKRNRVIDTAMINAATNIRDAINTWFFGKDDDGNEYGRELTSKEKVIYTKVGLKTDLSYLIKQGFSKDTIVNLTENEQAREDRIDALIQKMDSDPELKAHQNLFWKAADDLGFYMVHSAQRKGDHVNLNNAHNIVKLGNLTDKSQAKALDIVEELATLYALGYVPMASKRVMAALMKENWNAFENVMNQHNILKEQALKDSFFGIPFKMQKGYIKAILNDRIQYKEGTIHDMEEFTRMGYTMELSPLSRDPKDPVKEDIYMFKSNTGTINPHQSGIVATGTNTKKGADPFRVQMQLGNDLTAPAEADRINKIMIQSLEAKLTNMAKPTPRKPYTPTGTPNMMIPHFNDKGEMIGARYIMNEHTKDSVLQQFSEVDAVLGAMSSQIVGKKYSPQINNEVVDALKDMYDKEYDKFPGEYVDVSPSSNDPVLREIYHRLPDPMKTKIHSVWGSHGMMVNRDVVTLVFGQDKYSITELFQKDKQSLKLVERSLVEVMTFALGVNNPFIDAPLNATKDDSLETRRNKQMGRVVVRAKRIEEFATQLTSLAKGNIVVRNFKVIHGNYMSNMALLVSKGIPAHEILKGSREAINSALRYQDTNYKLNIAKAHRDVIERKVSLNRVEKDKQLKALNHVITRLEDEKARNPSTAMIAAGLLPSIVDDIDTSSIESPFKFGLDKFLDDSLNKLPSKLEKATRVLFMTTDTEGYRMMNNAVKMTDYVGRYVLYNHYTKKKGMSHLDAASLARDEFINFEIPTHKMLEYSNSIGVLWFSKYQLRVLKHIKNVLTTAPATALTVYILGSFMGLGDNIINSIPGITKGTFQNISTPWTTFMGTPGEILYADLLTKVGSTVVQ